ncbi:MAG: 4Fe-4S dicluster domain-containing protein [Candidatus Velthaea sp.]
MSPPAPSGNGTATGFFTDVTLCIGCKACEVACKQWNQLPSDGYAFSGDSYDNTQALSGTTWRHVAFVEQMDRVNPADSRWLMMSDVCKHCTNAGCLEACPTGAIIRNEFDNVYIQPEICNGCGYCVPSCPFGVVAIAPDRGVAQKCTLCYDRQRDGVEPACAKACPTDSIAFGPLDDLREKARARVEALTSAGTHVSLYGVDSTSPVGDLAAFFLLPERPDAFNLPPEPVLPSTFQRAAYTSGFAAALALGALMWRTFAPRSTS